MSMTRCSECHASIPMPAALDALVMRCQYCGREQPVPDLEARRRLLLEEQREARLRAEREAAAELERRREDREDRREAREERERKRAGRGRWVTWVFSLVPLLIAPAIIAVTVFDAPARLGFGASGADRLQQLQTQLATTGCTVVSAIESEYASGNVSRLLPVAAQQCVRVLAAGGSGHGSLALKLFSSTGKELAKSSDATDPQLAYCAKTADTLRYEIQIGPASKGRLSHLVLACPDPAKPADRPPADAPAPAKPTKPSKPKSR